MKTCLSLQILVCCIFIPAVVSDPVKDISPTFVPSRDVFFLLFTRLNPTAGQRIALNDISSVNTSNYDVKRPTRFLIHGFQTDSTTPVVHTLTAAYLQSYDVNVIVVDW